MHPLERRPPCPTRCHGHRRIFLSTLSTILALLLSVAAAGASAAVTIGAEPSFPGGYEFGGGPSVASIGQVVTVPVAVTTLEDFTLYPEAPPSFVFRAYVFAWNGTQTIGPALYESGTLHSVEESAYAALTIHTGGVPVTPGQRYVLFLSRSAEQSADEADTEGYALEIARGGMFEPPPYTEGGLVTLSNGYEPGAWGSATWSDFSAFYDAAFAATFDVPPPHESPQTPPQVTVVSNPPTSATPVITGGGRCVVPYLGGLRLGATKRALSAAGCTLGSIEHHYSALPTGEVTQQDAHQGTLLAVGRKIDVWLSRGAHRRRHRR